jgi:hypothetical protein
MDCKGSGNKSPWPNLMLLYHADISLEELRKATKNLRIAEI